jgi:hypothetical protein
MVESAFLSLRNQIRHQIMTIEQLKQRIMAGQQQYFNRDQVMELLDKLEPQKQTSNVLTLF